MVSFSTIYLCSPLYSKQYFSEKQTKVILDFCNNGNNGNNNDNNNNNSNKNNNNDNNNNNNDNNKHRGRYSV